MSSSLQHSHPALGQVEPKRVGCLILVVIDDILRLLPLTAMIGSRAPAW